MKRYAFRLEPVLRVRRMQEEVARGQLASATAAAAEQERLLAARTSAYENRSMPTELLPCADFLLAQATRSAFAAAVLEQRDRVARAYEQVAQARVTWSATASRVGALERLDERHRAEHLAQIEKEHDLITDELVVSRHGRSDR